MRELAVLYAHNRGDEDSLADIKQAVLNVWSEQTTNPANVWHDTCCSLLQVDSFSTTDSSVDFSDEYLAVVLNGELYNRSELQEMLAVSADDSAAQIVRKAYQRWGCDCVAKLFGDFCFSLWDNHTSTLLIARDYLGWRPMYYHWDQNRLLAGTSLRLFRSLPQAIRPLNTGYLAEYILNSFATVDETILDGVKRLLPGSYLIVNSSGLRLQQYWNPTSLPEIRYSNDDQYAEHFASLLHDACAVRTRGHSSVALSLSGGLDSSAVASVVAETQSVQGYSMEFPGRDCDERQLVEELAAQHNFQVQYLQAKLDSADWLANDIGNFSDLPSDPNGLFGRQIRRAASANNHRLMLTGFGGDELLAGGAYRYSSLVRSGQLQTLLNQLWSDPRPRDFVTDRIPRPWKQKLQQQFPRFRWIPDWATADFLRDTNIDQRLRTAWQAPGSLSLQHRTIYEQTYNSLALHLREMEYRNTLADDIVVRHPLYDHRIMQFCFAIPEEQLCKNGLSKFVLRNAFADLLPQNIRQRRGKADFSFVNMELLKLLGGKEVVLNLPIFELGWLERDRLGRIYDEMQAAYGKGSASYFPRAKVFWNIYCASRLIEAFNPS